MKYINRYADAGRFSKRQASSLCAVINDAAKVTGGLDHRNYVAVAEQLPYIDKRGNPAFGVCCTDFLNNRVVWLESYEGVVPPSWAVQKA